MRTKRKLERDLLGDTSLRERGIWTGHAAGDVATNPVTILGGLLAAILAFGWRPECLLLIPLVILAVLLVQRHRTRSEVDLPLVLPNPLTYSDTAARAAVERLAGARAAVWRSVRRARGLSRVLRGVTQVERRVLGLAARVEYLGNFLGTCVDASAERDLVRLRVGAAQPSTEITRAACQRAGNDRAAQVEDLQSLRQEYDVLLVTLDHLLAALERVPIRLARVRLLEIEGYSGAPAESSADVERLGEEIDVLQAAITRPETDQDTRLSD